MLYAEDVVLPEVSWEGVKTFTRPEMFYLLEDKRGGAEFFGWEGSRSATIVCLSCCLLFLRIKSCSLSSETSDNVACLLLES